MKFHTAFADSLARHGVRTVFGLVGDGNLYLVDSFVRAGKGEFVSVANEATAVCAAIGWAHVTSNVGVATVTHGPALTNSLTPLIEAVRAQVPVVLIAGDTAVLDRDNHQNIPQGDLIRAAGVGFEQLRAPNTLDEDLARAFRRARVERRSVVLNVPSDFQWADVEKPRRTWPTSQAESLGRPGPSSTALEEAAGLLASAKRPIVLAGRGAIDRHSRDALAALAALVGAPLATTLKAKDLFANEPSDLGIFGTLSSPASAELIADSDCVVAFGVSLNKFTTDRGALLRGKRVVQADLDPTAFGRYAEPDVAVWSDAATAARGLVSYLAEAEVTPTSFATRVQPSAAPEIAAGSAPLEIRDALARIDRALPTDRLVVTDVGRFMGHAWQILHVQDPNDWVHTVNYAAIGLGMGTALGAAAAAPHRTVLFVTGDGGFMLGGLHEFTSAVRRGADLVAVIMNDGAFGAEHIQLTNKDMDPAISTFDWPDLGPVATALGGTGYTVRTGDELQTALSALPDRSGPVLIDVRLDPSAIPSATH